MIVGAGLAGLIAAHAFPKEIIFEAAEQPREVHKALLRFRSDKVAQLTGIEFRKVRVRKGIWFNGSFAKPTIQIANLYSRKTLGALVPDRSIWNIEPVERWIAPENLYQQLLDSVATRIRWATDCDFRTTYDPKEPIISTAPLPVALKACGFLPDVEFKRAPIKVERWRVANCDAFQTIYYPAINNSVYRASITKDLLIIERAEGNVIMDNWSHGFNEVLNSFGLHQSQVSQLDVSEQKYGKIAPIDEGTRRAFVASLTTNFGVYSLGRFATWRNLLLDDVVDDIAVIKRLLRADHHERRIIAAGG